MEKYLRLGIYALGAILSLVVLFFVYVTPEDAAEAAAQQETGAGIGLAVTKIFIYLCAAGWLIFGLIQLIDNKEKLMRFVIFVGVLLVLSLIGYAVSSGVVGKGFVEAGINTEGMSKLIGGLLTLPAILGGLAIALIVAAEVRRSIS